MSEHEPGGDPERSLGAPPRPLSRRELMAWFGGTAASLASGADARPAGETRYLQEEVRRTGPDAKIVAVHGLDLHDLDPQSFKSLPGYYAAANLYDNLFAYDYEPDHGGLRPVAGPGGGWRLRPWLARDWEVSPDRKTLTFHLRRDVRFSDGSPLTAHDVKATWDRGLAEAGGYMSEVFHLASVTRPEQIDVTGRYTVVLRLAEPEVFALDLLATNILNIMSGEALERHRTDADPRARRYFEKHAVGSAPYVLRDWEPGREWRLAPNPRFWNPDAMKNGGIINRVVPSSHERARMVLEGQADLAFNLHPEDLAVLRSHPEVRLFNFRVPWPYYLGMANHMPPFDNVKVRQALSHVLPYREIIREVMKGFADEVRSPVAAGMPTSDYSFWNYDGGPRRAKELLREAGVRQLSFELAVLSGFPQHIHIARLIRCAAARIGGRVKIVRMPDAEYYAKHQARQLQAWIGEFYSWVNDPIYHLYWNFLSTNSINATGYSNPRVDEIIETGLFDTNAARREALSREAQQIIVEEAPWGLLFQIHYVVAGRRNVRGYNWNPDIGARFWMVSKD
jgi:peptide/nickel transport system substrate-binding protein